MDYLSLLGASPDDLFDRLEARKWLRKTAMDGYYVYLLWRVDKDVPIPFYVGKGTGLRFVHHEAERKSRNNFHRWRIISYLRQTSSPVKYSFPLIKSPEEDALEEEMRIVSVVGRHAERTGPLTNLTIGGENRPSRPVYAADALYSSVTAAAAALAVHPPAITRRIKRGWSGYYYVDEGQREQVAPHRKYAVVINNIEYPNQSTAAAAMGIPLPTIQWRIQNRKPGYVSANPFI